jgi:hypothetical protein
MILELEMLDYWHCGSGKGSADYFGALADRDSLGLPFVPGRLLKGLLRDALARCEAFGHVASGMAESLFGARNNGCGEGGPSYPPRPGALRVADARLPEALRSWLRAPGGAAYRQALYRELFAAAVEDSAETEGGCRSRGMEVVVPLVLESELRPIEGLPLPSGWQASLAAALPLLGAVGAYRTRGLGRCEVRFAKGAECNG